MNLLKKFKSLIKAIVPRSLHGIMRRIFIDPFATTYLICSYGGCGSVMLMGFIAEYHKIKHVHSRFPPEELTSVEINPPKIDNSFTNNKVNPKRYRVVYIFRYPWMSLISRYSRQLCVNNDGDYDRFPKTIDEYARLGEDIMRYREHFEAYTKKTDKNYEIVCINYHKMWDNLETVIKALQLPRSAIRMFPKRVERNRCVSHDTMRKLREMYKDLDEEIDRFPAVKVISHQAKMLRDDK